MKKFQEFKSEQLTEKLNTKMLTSKLKEIQVAIRREMEWTDDNDDDLIRLDRMDVMLDNLMKLSTSLKK